MEDIILAEPQKIDDLTPKMRLKGTIKKTSLAGAIVDIGLDIPAVIHISQLQKDPVSRVEDIVAPGQEVEVWVRRVFPKKQRIELTMIEPLALEWREIEKDMVLKGKVTRLEKFGAFVEIGAERPGLVHISELTHDYIRTVDEIVKPGDDVEVKVLEVNRQKKQIKLSMKALEEKPEKITKVIQDKFERKGKVTKESKESAPAEAPEAPIPTAMEIALREAMERVQDDEIPVQKKRKSSTNELGDILKRTLDQKAVTK